LEAADRRHVILVADGDRAFRAFVTRVLTTEGCRVREAATGGEALAVVEEERVAVVVIEVRLEGPSGYEVCRRLREIRGQALPIVFVLMPCVRHVASARQRSPRTERGASRRPAPGTLRGRAAVRNGETVSHLLARLLRVFPRSDAATVQTF